MKTEHDFSSSGTDLNTIARPLRSGLARLRGRVRTLLLVYGSARTILVLVAALVVMFAADYTLRLPLAVRQATLLILAGSVLTLIWRRILLPLRHPLADATLAARVEERFPELQDRLVSSLAFLHAQDNPENGDSPELMRAVIEETVQLAPGIRFLEVARAQSSIRWAGGAAALTIFVLVLMAARPSLARTFFDRDILLRDVTWPRRTTLVVLDMSPDEPREVTLHQDTLLRFQVEGSVPERLELRYRETGSTGGSTGGGDRANADSSDSRRRGPEEIVELAPSADDASLFTFNLLVDADYEFTVTGGDDDRAVIYRVKALTPPAAVSIQLHCTYPEYLGLEPEVRTGGDQRVPESTKIDLEIQVNMDLRTAKLLAIGETPLDMKALGDRRYRVHLEPKQDFRYSFLLQGLKGEQNEPHTFVLRLSRDRAPDLRFRTPSAYTERVAGGVVLASFTAHDDHRIVSARLRYQLGHDGTGRERVVMLGESGGDAVRFLRAPGEDEKSLLGLVVMDLSRIQGDDGKLLSAGADGALSESGLDIRYSIDVTDSAGKQTSSRQGRRVVFVPSGNLQDELGRRQRDLAETAETVEALAASVRIELMEAMTDSLGDSPTAPVADAEANLSRQLGRTQAAAGRLVGQLSRISRDVNRMLDLYVMNRLDDKATAEQALQHYERHLLAPVQREGTIFGGALYRGLYQAQQQNSLRAGGAYRSLFELADLADRLAVDHAPLEYELLRKASAARTERADVRGHLQSAGVEHEAIERGLRRLRRLIREWQNYESVVRGLRRLKSDEERIVEGLKDSEDDINRR